MTNEGECEHEASIEETQDSEVDNNSGRSVEELEGDKQNVIAPDDFPTLKLTLEEARRQYDDEERRRAAVENKIGIVVTVDALLISFGALFGKEFHPLLIVAVMGPALASAGLGLYAIRSREYKRPGKSIWDFHDYSTFENVDNQREQLLLDYVTTTGSNKARNNPKFSHFNWCIFLTFISLVLVLLTPVAQHLHIDDWIINQVK